MPLSKMRNRDRMRINRTGNASIAVQPNPFGMRRKFLSKEESLELLADIAINGNRKLCSPVEAIKEYNRLEGRYPPQQHLVAQKVIIEVVHSDRRQLQAQDNAKSLPQLGTVIASCEELPTLPVEEKRQLASQEVVDNPLIETVNRLHSKGDKLTNSCLASISTNL